MLAVSASAFYQRVSVARAGWRLADAWLFGYSPAASETDVMFFLFFIYVFHSF